MAIPGTAFILVGAGLLIIVGLVFQLGELGYGNLGPGNFWLVSVIGECVWHLLVARLNALDMHELTGFWPLLPVSFGLAILLVARQGNRAGARALPGSGVGENHGE